MSNKTIYYVYSYLREDGTPYYIGKGCKDRINAPHAIPLPPKERRVFLQTNLSESEAFALEIELINKWGRKDIGTGILRNLTNGGEGVSGNDGKKARNTRIERGIPWWTKESRQKGVETRKQRLGGYNSTESIAKMSNTQRQLGYHLATSERFKALSGRANVNTLKTLIEDLKYVTKMIFIPHNSPNIKSNIMLNFEMLKATFADLKFDNNPSTPNELSNIRNLTIKLVCPPKSWHLFNDEYIDAKIKQISNYINFNQQYILQILYQPT